MFSLLGTGMTLGWRVMRVDGVAEAMVQPYRRLTNYMPSGRGKTLFTEQSIRDDTGRGNAFPSSLWSADAVKIYTVCMS